jgi:anti-sigma B factor antagonist
MSQAHVSMDVRIVDDRISIIAIRGELSWSAEAPLMDAYLRACADAGDTAIGTHARRSPTAIIFDFNHMVYMNSGGIGLLITLLIRMHRQRQRMLAYGLSEHYQQIFAITRLDQVISIFDSAEEALASASST